MRKSPAAPAAAPERALIETKTRAEAIQASEIIAQVDELGRLEDELRPWEPKLRRVEALRKAIRAQFDASPAAEAFEAGGEKYIVMLGARAKTKVIHLAKLFRALGPKRFLECANVTLAGLDRGNVDVGTRGMCVTEEQTGIRSLKVFPRP